MIGEFFGMYPHLLLLLNAFAASLTFLYSFVTNAINSCFFFLYSSFAFLELPLGLPNSLFGQGNGDDSVLLNLFATTTVVMDAFGHCLIAQEGLIQLLVFGKWLNWVDLLQWRLLLLLLYFDLLVQRILQSEQQVLYLVVPPKNINLASYHLYCYLINLYFNLLFWPLLAPNYMEVNRLSSFLGSPG